MVSLLFSRAADSREFEFHLSAVGFSLTGVAVVLRSEGNCTHMINI